MTTLKESRAEVATVLEDATPLKALTYVSENITPPGFAVVPGRPYLQTRGEGIPFGCTRVAYDVLILVAREAAGTTADKIDDLIESAFVALNDEFDVTEVAQPGVVTLSGAKFMGSVLTIHHDIKL